MSLVPKDLKYAKTHEWVRVEGDTATVGITDFAQSELSDVVFVELPAIGKKLARSDTMGTVEAVKAVSDIYAPVSGEVVAVNDDLRTDPAIVNKEPYGRGWIVRVRLASEADLNALLGPTDYEVLAAKSAH